jgi:hypothetical protein
MDESPARRKVETRAYRRVGVISHFTDANGPRLKRDPSRSASNGQGQNRTSGVDA